MRNNGNGRLTIIMPVYNDWTSATRLIADISDALADLPIATDVLAVDDCSTQPLPADLPGADHVGPVRVIRLMGNVGHQRAIAIGLIRVTDEGGTDLIAVMDSDGEDRPAELRRLVEAALLNPAEIIVARRQKRSEGWMFRLFYWIYLRLFRLLTGRRIQFGNFSVLSFANACRIANSVSVWNNFAATLISARLPLRYVPTVRGKRYAGRSTMNFVSLVAHGLGAISVFSETVFIRILISSSVIFSLSICFAAAALVLRLFTPLAIPGWATEVLGFSVVVSIQALITPILIAFLMLNNRSAVQVLPRSIVPSLIQSEHILNQPGRVAALSAVQAENR